MTTDEVCEGVEFSAAVTNPQSRARAPASPTSDPRRRHLSVVPGATRIRSPQIYDGAEPVSARVCAELRGRGLGRSVELTGHDAMDIPREL